MQEKVARKILEKFGEKLVMRKSEVLSFMKGIKNPGDSQAVIEAALKKLVERRLIVPVYSSSSTFAITQKGMKELRS